MNWKEMQFRNLTQDTWELSIERRMQFESLMWHDFPVMFINRERNILLVWYDYEKKGNRDLWFMIKNPVGVKEYITCKKTLRELLLEGITYLIYYDYEKDKYTVLCRLSRKRLLKSFVLPALDSYYKTRKEM